MSDRPDFQKQQARLEAEALSARQFRLQLWTPPQVSSWPIHHQDPLILEFGTLFIFLARVRQSLTTANPMSWRGPVRDKVSAAEQTGNYNLSQLAREALIALIRQKQLGRKQHEIPCVSLNNFQEQLLGMVLERCKDNFNEGMFYFQLVHERLKDWRKQRSLTMIREALEEEAFRRECAVVFNKYLAYCQCWIDQVPYISAQGHEVPLNQVRIFLQNVETATGIRPQMNATTLRQSFLKIAAHLRLSGEQQDLYFVPGFPTDLYWCVHRYVGTSGFDFQAAANRLLLQVMPPVCRLCRVKSSIQSCSIRLQSDCIDCTLLASARRHADERYPLEESLKRIHAAITQQHQFCPCCLRQFLDAFTGNQTPG